MMGDGNRKISYSIIIETVFAAVVAQNVLMISKPIVSFYIKNISLEELITFLLIGFINIVTLIANWISSKKTEEHYNTVLFLEDISTLTVFAVFTQSVVESFDNGVFLIRVSNIFCLYSCFYFLIYIFFVIWNTSELTYAQEEKSVIQKSLKMNALVIVSIIMLIITIVKYSFFWQKAFFFISIIIQFLVLIYYYFLLISEKKIHPFKSKAIWLGAKSKYWAQIRISIVSLFRKNPKGNQKVALKAFWSKYYQKLISDDYVFDAGNKEYLEKIEILLKLVENITDLDIIDLCCGNGNLFSWLASKNISFHRYMGIDFAIKDKTLADNAKIVENDILKLESDYFSNQSIVFVVNGVCYFNDKDFVLILQKIKGVKYIVIVEPIKSLFWDKNFDDIRIFYRNYSRIVYQLSLYDFELLGASIDYTIKIQNRFLLPLSCAYLFKRIDKSKKEN